MSANSATRLGAQWNQWLLQECAPHAWARNLEFIRSENLSPGWDFWPVGKQGEWGNVLWMGILGKVFKKVVEDGYELLPTLNGVVKSANKVAFTLDIPEDLHFSLRDAGALASHKEKCRSSGMLSVNATSSVGFTAPLKVGRSS